MSKIDNNKQQKRDSLLDTAFQLFTSKGIQNTSISDIVHDAGVAKGTFYLYFKDKYDICNKLIVHKSRELLQRAGSALKQTDITNPADRVIFLADHIINQFVEDKKLLTFIAKKLNWRIVKGVVLDVMEDNGEYENKEIMAFLIIELVSGACYSAILYGEPVEIEELKPYIFRTIRQIMEAHDTGRG